MHTELVAPTMNNDDAIADLRKGLTLKPNETRRKQMETALQELGVTP